MRLSYLIPYKPESLERLAAIGLSAIQLRLGPEFPISLNDPEMEEAKRAAEDLRVRGIRVDALGLYRNHLDARAECREEESARLRMVMKMAPLFGTDTIGVFAGRDPEKSIEDSIADFREVWTPLAQEAEDRGLRLAFENCPMFRGYPVRGINLAHCPAAYELMFEAVPSPALGIEFDPSHCLKQRIDPLRFLQQFPGRTFHVHAKDHEVDEEKLQRYGCFDVRMSGDRFPGLGKVDFKGMFEELRRQGFDGSVTIEAEREPTVTDEESRRAALRKSVGHLRACGVEE